MRAACVSLGFERLYRYMTMFKALQCGHIVDADCRAREYNSSSCNFNVNNSNCGRAECRARRPSPLAKKVYGAAAATSASGAAAPEAADSGLPAVPVCSARPSCKHERVIGPGDVVVRVRAERVPRDMAERESRARDAKRIVAELPCGHLWHVSCASDANGRCVVCTSIVERMVHVSVESATRSRWKVRDERAASSAASSAASIDSSDAGDESDKESDEPADTDDSDDEAVEGDDGTEADDVLSLEAAPEAPGGHADLAAAAATALAKYVQSKKKFDTMLRYTLPAPAK
jgi:hypothetical protein